MHSHPSRRGPKEGDVALVAASFATLPYAAPVLGATSLTSSTASKPRSIRTSLLSDRGILAAVALLAQICTVMFFCALSTPFFAPLSIG
jgi:hypothetical protein